MQWKLFAICKLAGFFSRFFTGPIFRGENLPRRSLSPFLQNYDFFGPLASNFSPLPRHAIFQGQP